MQIISHRGNTTGPNHYRENSPEYLKEALALGYDVEVDVWYQDGKIYFGHDGPKYEVGLIEFEYFIPRGWFHCKNISAMGFLSQHYMRPNFFWHQSDDYALTSHKYIWTYPHMPTAERSIAVLPEIFNANRNDLNNFWGICTDYCIEFDPSQSQ